MTQKNSHLCKTLFVMLALVIASPAHASRHGIPEHGQPALEGYSPVSYYEKGRPELGSSHYRSAYEGNVYWFTSAKQKAVFDKAPAA
ncbi:MAG: hypothetical protein CVV16_06355 [Gammaproteobacteria bacterium HGW-Gammaproteobacteria-6]|nr:MAG: hypothetical protein CVV16_06355 [Gammaproteobacteria bacterium HGW-Gammaproteobacteria-6]